MEDQFEVVQQSPEKILRKIFENFQENQLKNEYYYESDGKLIGPYNSIKEAIEALSGDE